MWLFGISRSVRGRGQLRHAEPTRSFYSSRGGPRKNYFTLAKYCTSKESKMLWEDAMLLWCCYPDTHIYLESFNNTISWFRNCDFYHAIQCCCSNSRFMQNVHWKLVGMQYRVWYISEHKIWNNMKVMPCLLGNYESLSELCGVILVRSIHSYIKQSMLFYLHTIRCMYI